MLRIKTEGSLLKGSLVCLCREENAAGGTPLVGAGGQKDPGSRTGPSAKQLWPWETHLSDICLWSRNCIFRLGGITEFHAYFIGKGIQAQAGWGPCPGMVCPLTPKPGWNPGPPLPAVRPLHRLHQKPLNCLPQVFGGKMCVHVKWHQRSITSWLRVRTYYFLHKFGVLQIYCFFFSFSDIFPFVSVDTVSELKQVSPSSLANSAIWWTCGKKPTWTNDKFQDFLSLQGRSHSKCRWNYGENWLSPWFGRSRKQEEGYSISLVMSKTASK